MWIARVTRRQLVDVLEDRDTSRLDLNQTGKATPTLKDEIALLWRVSPKRHFELPVVIVVPDEHMGDFLAWSGTYLGGTNPVSAFCRVLATSDMRLAQKASTYPALGNAQNAAIGLILGELQMLAGPHHAALRHAFMAHRASHAFAIARGIAVYGPEAPVSRLSSAWKNTRWRTETAAIADELLLAPWSAIAELLPSRLRLTTPVNPLISRACQEVGRAGELAPNTWEELTSAFSWLRHAQHETTGPRESRVAFTEAALAALGSSDESVAAFLGGYLLSRVSPGSFDHAHLVTPATSPRALPWYGLLAGLHYGFSLAEGGPLRHLLLRDLMQKVSLDDYPDCDSNYDEWRLTGRVAIESNMRGGHAIEVLPGVCVVAQQVEPRRSRKDENVAESGGTQQGRLFRGRDSSN